MFCIASYSYKVYSSKKELAGEHIGHLSPDAVSWTINAPINYHLLYGAPMIFIDKQLPPPIKIGSLRVVHD